MFGENKGQGKAQTASGTSKKEDGDTLKVMSFDDDIMSAANVAFITALYYPHVGISSVLFHSPADRGFVIKYQR